MYVETNKFNVWLMSSSTPHHSCRGDTQWRKGAVTASRAAGHLPVFTSVQFSRAPTACVGTRRVVYRENRAREHPVNGRKANSRKSRRQRHRRRIRPWLNRTPRYPRDRGIEDGVEHVKRVGGKGGGASSRPPTSKDAGQHDAIPPTANRLNTEKREAKSASVAKSTVDR